jgi:hypothetical protein
MRGSAFAALRRTNETLRQATSTAGCDRPTARSAAYPESPLDRLAAGPMFAQAGARTCPEHADLGRRVAPPLSGPGYAGMWELGQPGRELARRDVRVTRFGRSDTLESAVAMKAGHDTQAGTPDTLLRSILELTCQAPPARQLRTASRFSENG